MISTSGILSLSAQSAKSTLVNNSVTKQSFISIHKDKDSPFEIYQDLIQDQMVIRLKNQFDVLRFEIRDYSGKSLNIKGIQDRNEVHADLKTLSDGMYRMIIDRNNEKIFTEFQINRTNLKGEGIK